MNKALKIILVFALIVTACIAGMAVYVSHMNVATYKPQIEKMLAEKLGRKVTLNGPLAFSLGLDGVHVVIKGVTIGNAAWASRPNLAEIGTFELVAELVPLLSHHIDVVDLSLSDADVLLETNAAGAHNYEFKPMASEPEEKHLAVPSAETSSQAAARVVPASMPGALKIDHLTLVKIHVGMRSSDGKLAFYDLAHMTLTMGNTGAVVNLDANINGVAAKLILKTDIRDLLSKAPFNFDADGSYGPAHVTAQGEVDIAVPALDVKTYAFTYGKTLMTGKLDANESKGILTIHGKLLSDHVDLSEFANAARAASPGADPKTSEAPRAAPSTPLLLSSEPLPFDKLRSLSTDFQVNIGELVMGQGVLKTIEGHLQTANGRMTLDPIKMLISDMPVTAKVTLDAGQNPAHLNVNLAADGVDLADLQKLGNHAPILSGKANAHVTLAGEGNSLHQIASSLDGVITVTTDRGEIIGSAMSGVAAPIVALLDPSGGNAVINCMALRFIAKNGVLSDNGMLLDSTAATMAAKGSINLNTETVAFDMQAKTKLVTLAHITPAANIRGTLKNPTYAVDTQGLVNNLVGAFTGGSTNSSVGFVPVLQNAPDGSSACIYTLDHPKNVSSPASPLPADPLGKAGQKLKDLGGSVFKGLLGQ